MINYIYFTIYNELFSKFSTSMHRTGMILHSNEIKPITNFNLNPSFSQNKNSTWTTNLWRF